MNIIYMFLSIYIMKKGRDKTKPIREIKTCLFALAKTWDLGKLQNIFPMLKS